MCVAALEDCCQKPAGNLGSLHSFSAESESDKSQIKVSMFTLLSGDFALLHALITKKGIFPKNCDAL